MARFYVGQPVVCIWGEELWTKNPVLGDVSVPRKGQRYQVEGYLDQVLWGSYYVHLVGMDSSYCEDGFAPITGDQVEEIMREALRPPQTVERKREREDA